MVTAFVDPWTPGLCQDRLFEFSTESDAGERFTYCWWKLRQHCHESGIELRTADQIGDVGRAGHPKLYYSLGQATNYKRLRYRNDVVLCSLYLLEPPLNATVPCSRDPYHQLDDLNRCFRRLYLTCSCGEVNRVCGTHYSFETRRFRYAQNRDFIISDLWSRRSRKLLVMVNSYNCTRTARNNYYYERTRALHFFATRREELDLYGERWLPLLENPLRTLLYSLAWGVKYRSVMQLKSVLNLISCRTELRKMWKGSTRRKYETLSQYDFAICYESVGVPGFMSEKLFDCLFVGTIPIYLGDPEVAKNVPSECFVDKRLFTRYSDLIHYVRGMSAAEKEERRAAGRAFLASAQFEPFMASYWARQFIDDVWDDVTYAQRLKRAVNDVDQTCRGEPPSCGKSQCRPTP